jgi:O-antigen ligase
MTASRGGFIDLAVTGAVCLWVFGVKGKRIHLIVAAAVVLLVIGVTGGGKLKERFYAISANNVNNDLDESAWGSYQQRRLLMTQSLTGIVHYPIGMGVGNFTVYSGMWREVHVAYLQIAVEGGIASLVLYLLFFARGFSNLKKLRRMPNHDPEVDLHSGALYATLVGFIVGALFAPEAYQYFPYFAVAYTSVLLAIVKEREATKGSEAALPNQSQPGWRTRPRLDDRRPLRGEGRLRIPALLRDRR